MKTNWHAIWERKAAANTEDLYLINGYENTNFSPKHTSDFIIKTLSIDSESSVLEVGCGAGLLVEYFGQNYTGVDYSQNMIKKIKKLVGDRAHVAEANNLPFPDNSFDYVFCNGVFHYFPTKVYAKQAIKEITRVARNSVFIGDLPLTSHDKSHLLFKKSMFSGWTITPSTYNKDRFNISKTLV